MNSLDQAVMDRLRAPFGCELITGADGSRWWRIHDDNDDAIASVSGREEGYARLLVQALNEHFEKKAQKSNMTVRPITSTCGLCGAMEMVCGDLKITHVRDAAAVGFLMGLGANHVGLPTCSTCVKEVNRIIRLARAKNTD